LLRQQCRIFTLYLLWNIKTIHISHALNIQPEPRDHMNPRRSWTDIVAP